MRFGKNFHFSKTLLECQLFSRLKYHHCNIEYKPILMSYDNTEDLTLDLDLTHPLFVQPFSVVVSFNNYYSDTSSSSQCPHISKAIQSWTLTAVVHCELGLPRREACSRIRETYSQLFNTGLVGVPLSLENTCQGSRCLH